MSEVVALLLDDAIPASERLGRELREMTFVIVDLETTGGSAEVCDITEIGAVKVRGGEVLGEFATLVRPRSGGEDCRLTGKAISRAGIPRSRCGWPRARRSGAGR